MAKNIRRMLSMVLVMCMFVSALPMQALAAEGETIEQDGLTITITPSESNGGSGSSTSSVDVSGTSESTGADVDMEGTKEVTTETTKDSDNTTTNIETNVDLKGTVTEDNVRKDATWQETTKESSTTDAEGNEIKSNTIIDGESTKKWDVPEDDGTTEPDVTIDLVPGQTTTSEGIVQDSLKTETNTQEDGTVVTNTTYETDRTVTATTSEVNVTVHDTSTGNINGTGNQLTPAAPTYDEFNGQLEDKVGVNDNLFDTLIFTQLPSDWEVVDGGEYRFVGYGEDCKYYIATVEVFYEKDENGNTRYDSDGNPIVKDIRTVSGTNVTINGEDAFSLEGGHLLSPYNGTIPATLQFKDKNGKKVYAYCCDENTPTIGGAWYTVANLEDSDYYASEEAENHIRAIALNGYWGSSDIPKSDGSYATGSLEKIKQSLKEAIAQGELDAMYEMNCFTENGKLLRDENGQPVTKMVNMLDIIDGLTAGEALSATQAAIWSYSNGHQNALNGVDGTVIVAPDYRANHKSTQSDKLDDFGGARIAFLYDWLMNLKTETKPTTVINEKNFLEDVKLVVGDQVADHADNQDPDENNNVYNTSMNFTLAFSVGEDDELIVYLMDEHGSVMKDKDGNDIIKHLAPKGAEAANGYICPAADGSYTLTGLQLSENEDFKFDLRLEGTQYLEQGVYLYQPIGGRTSSQTAVGVAEGAREVDVSCAMTIKFDVDENNYVVAERKWHYESDPSTSTPGDGEPVPANFEDALDPQIFRLNNQDNLVEIPEEPVPLATPAVTGDNSGLWIAVVLLSVFAMAAINLFDKKRQHESF